FFGIAMTLGVRAIMHQVSIMAGNIFLSASLVAGTILTALVKAQYLRQEAEHKVVTSMRDMEIQVDKDKTDAEAVVDTDRPERRNSSTITRLWNN
ncbi:hypothetical protein BaRGS_00005635, partial [Batillaria attramentaria]